MLATIVLLPFLSALLGRLLWPWLGHRVVWCLVISATVCTVLVVQLLTTTVTEPPILDWPWLPSLGISFRLRGDTFGLMFALLISGVGALVGVYARYYLPTVATPALNRFYVILQLYMGAMLGIALADHLLLLFVFWEITSITSFVLVGYRYEDDQARRGAITALQVTGAGGLCLLAGLVLLGEASGSYHLSELLGDAALRERLLASPLAGPALVLILLAVFTKSAQIPFHFWLPGAMTAPTPVSTYLHAATMVKAGVFVLGRLHPLFSGGDLGLWSPVLITLGGLTFLVSAYLALLEHDLKAILARTTLSALGLFTLLYGVNLPAQDALQMLNHAAYKGTLFLVAGMVEHATHTRDIRQLGGLRRTMPITLTLAVIGVLSMAGVPPTFGFVAKESLYSSLLASDYLLPQPALHGLVLACAVLANAFLGAAGLRFLVGVFWGFPRGGHDGHEAERGLWLPAAVLASIALGLGFIALGPWLQSAMNALSSDPMADVHVALIPSAKYLPALGLSVLTLSLALVFYGLRDWLADHRPLALLPTTALGVWEGILHGWVALAEGYSQRWQNGRLSWYLGVVFAFFAATAGFALLRPGWYALGNGVGTSVVWFAGALLAIGITALLQATHHWWGVAVGIGVVIGAILLWVVWGDIDPGEVTVLAVIAGILLAIGVVALVRAPNRLSAVIITGVVGYLIALIYVIYRSPDILLTQLLIETASTLFFLLVLYFLPTRAFEPQPWLRRWFSAAVASAVGMVFFSYVLLATSDTFRQTRNLADEYLSRALDEAGGANAVNVVIVDFRSIDTTGEVVVLVVVGLVIFALLRTRRFS